MRSGVARSMGMTIDLDTDQVQAALAGWRAIAAVDGGGVDATDAADTVAGPNQATLAAGSSIIAVVTPSSAAQVGPCLAVARRFGIPVHPVSRGCNWGYGSRLPVRGQAALLSLSRLDRVLRHDEALATVRIQPGVTFRGLAGFLAAAGSGLLPPSTGSGPHTSVLGNVLERGIGKDLYEDMAAHACGFEVVLPCGTVLQTGPGGQSGTLAGLAKEATGPGLHELFIQGNLGVVTAVDLWLHPAPALRQLAWAMVPAADVLANCIDTLRPLLLRGDPRLRVELVSRQRARTQGVGTAKDDGWIAVVRLWGENTDELRLRREAAFSALHAGGANGADAGAIESGAAFDMDGEGLRGAYAAKPGGMPPEPDPDRDQCGVVWAAPILPLRGAAVAGAVADMQAIMERHGFPAALSLRHATGRTIKAVAGLFYDRDETGGDARAAACSRGLHGWMRTEGYAPYRSGILDMDEAADPGRRGLLRTLKRALDPACVLSPGRYTA